MAKKETVFRSEIVRFLNGNVAYMSFDEAIANFPTKAINTKAQNVDYTFWHILEHIRITQHDILDFCINPNYVYIKWPDDYWPKQDQKASFKQWNDTISEIKRELALLIKLVEDPKNDLYKKFPWGEGQNLLREAILVAEHNAYHIGEFAILRQVMGLWPKKH